MKSMVRARPAARGGDCKAEAELPPTALSSARSRCLRFLFISSITGSSWGGSEELWSRAALRLRKQGHRVSVCMVQSREPSPKFLALAKEGIRLHMQRRHIPVSLRAWNKLKGMLGYPSHEHLWAKHENPDLAIISQGSNADGLNWMELCQAMQIPFVAVVQANGEHWWPDDRLVGRLAAAYRAARGVVCVSRGNLEMLRRQLGESLPNAVVVWNPYNVSADRLPSWPAENGIWKMACVARLDPATKGQDLLFEVLSHPRWRERPLELHLYGGGGWETGLRRLAEYLRLQNVHFHGHVDRVETIWEQNHILVLPSRYEGLPLALVEAMWCGRPAIVTDVAGNAEVCVDGKTGFVAAAPAVKLLEETLERAWNQREGWQCMGLAARARAAELIPKDPVESFCSRLQELAARPGKAGYR
jgi:glycosyltransferase involved in cell wall biosynthesis